VLNQIGQHPESGAAVQVLAGRYGPYVTDGKTNASLPKNSDPAKLTMEEAVGLLKAREQAAPSKRPGGRRGAARVPRRKAS
jgi:DNA topoisomerase-1